MEDWRFESHYSGRRRGNASKINDSLTICFQELDDARFLKQLRLKPNVHYRVTVHAIGKKIVPQHKGGVGANVCLFGTWTHSSQFKNGTGSFKGDLSVEFCAPKDGVATIGLRLGYWGCEAKGEVSFSNLRVEELDYVMIGDGPVRIYIDMNTCERIDVEEVELLMQRLAQVYNVMSGLYGCTPFDGEPVSIELQRGLQAWAYAGNPILWNYDWFLAFMRELSLGDNACFGIIHEMGHNFDMSGLKINPELMANFNLCYAVEKLNLPIFFDGEFSLGRGLQDGFYKRCYEKTIARGKYHHDGLLYCLLRIKDAIGWQPFEQTMRKFAAVKPVAPDGPNALDFWLRVVSQNCGRDVREIFKAGEYDLIMKQEKL